MQIRPHLNTPCDPTHQPELHFRHGCDTRHLYAQQQSSTFQVLWSPAIHHVTWGGVHICSLEALLSPAVVLACSRRSRICLSYSGLWAFLELISHPYIQLRTQATQSSYLDSVPRVASPLTRRSWSLTWPARGPWKRTQLRRPSSRVWKGSILMYVASSLGASLI